MAHLTSPVTLSFSTDHYSASEPYDPSAVAPADWKLLIGLESSSSNSILAVCSGMLSTVPPDEVLGKEFSTLGLHDSPRPAVSRYYLQPDPANAAAWPFTLRQSFLGEAIWWFVYDNVDTTSLAVLIRTALAANISLAAELPDPVDQEMAFLLGQVSVKVTMGAPIGSASTANASTANHFHIGFGVHTSFGYVDPVQFFDQFRSHFDESEQSKVDELKVLVGTSWPFIAPDVSGVNLAALKAAAAHKLYPNAVLQEMIARLLLEPGGSEWLQIAAQQKVQYLAQLQNKASGKEPHFIFNTDEMVNPFQLEAVVEFYLLWKTPGASPLPAIPNLNALNQVNLSLNDSIQIVLVDPFDHEFLGNPALPRPDFALNSYKLVDVPQGQKKVNCAGIEADSFPPDDYLGVLFLVFQGQVKAWYRWTSYTSCRWEDPANSSCDYLASSIQGNLPYKFWSRTGGSIFINFAFEVWYAGDDPDVLLTRDPNQSDFANDVWVPGKFYYRDGVPVDKNGKTLVNIHYGLTRQDLTTVEGPQYDYSYSGSGGCMVSPMFHALRALIIDYALKDPFHDNSYDDVLKDIQSKMDHASSMALFDSWQAYLHDYKAKWNANPNQSGQKTISGAFWLVRPDEPTKK